MIAIWDTRFSVGNALADAEHRQVISILNEIDVACRVGAPPEVMGKALESLAQSIDAHFAHDTPPRSDHLAIAASARRLLEAWRSGTPNALERRVLVNLARRWIDHMGRQEAAQPSQRMAG
ncbi:conserved protein of unknown function(Haemerythrin-like, metal-binding,2-61) [Magnetospirillum sp. XM-1]|uniref:hypothetical protein n=1 Tax=Magnetospirillum sp. XM-1 TaxID=1663591 RepID=UPI00073DFEEF|nr:hypothetical protein [Magnetospirillum sp. XM-1]CUW38356.1 conserved protein of unknown function(Haemerythrin-like, metal-binding,2-61) [Magnetospirillum sp. XM-1]